MLGIVVNVQSELTTRNAAGELSYESLPFWDQITEKGDFKLLRVLYLAIAYGPIVLLSPFKLDTDKCIKTLKLVGEVSNSPTGTPSSY